ncbi:MAG: phage tail protein [Chloroflexota bacterium]
MTFRSLRAAAGIGGALLSGRMDAISNFRFHVMIDGIWMASFQEVTLPTLTLETTDITEGGQNLYKHKLPLRVDVGTITLKHGLTFDMHLMAWYFDILEGNIAGSKRTLAIALFNVARMPVSTIMLSDAFPVKYSGPSFDAGGDSTVLEELEIAFTEFAAW